MTHSASTPRWLKFWGLLIAVPLLLVAIAYLASATMLVVLFKGMPPFPIRPWHIVQYAVAYPHNKKVMLPVFISLAVVLGMMFGMAVALFRRKKVSQHGEARFATEAEERKLGLYGGEGFIVGRRGKHYLQQKGNHHILIAAATGTGKGVGPVIGNLLSLDGSMIVTDIKKTNWAHTAKFRASVGQKVFLFDPGDAERRTHRWNPLSYIAEDHSTRVNDVQTIANLIYPDIQGTDPIWSGGCRTLFLGIVLYLLETPGKLVTMGQVARESFIGDAKRFLKAIEDRKAAGNPYSSACVLALTDYASSPDKTRDSIRKTFTSRLELFLLPNVDAATSANDFDLRRLRKEPMTIYLGAPAKDMARFGMIMNLFFQQALALNTATLPLHDPELKVPLTLLMDEFRALGKMPTVLEAIAYAREYMVRIVPVFQGPAQLYELYGHEAAKAFIEQFTIRLCFEPPTHAVAKEISEELGVTTVDSGTISTPVGFGGGNKSKSVGQAGRNLMLAEELQVMGDKQAIIFARGSMPIKCEKVFFYQEKVFVERLKAMSPHLRAHKPTRKAPFPTQADYEIAMQRNELAPIVPVAPMPDIEPPPTPTDDRPIRPVVAADLATLDSRPLSDFVNLDFSGVVIPGPPASDDELEDFSDDLYKKLVT